MIAHVTVDHELDNPAKGHKDTQEVKRGKEMFTIESESLLNQKLKNKMELNFQKHFQ